MKKRWLSLILVIIFIIPLLFVVSSCSKNKEDRLLSNFAVLFNNVLETEGINAEDIANEIGTDQNNLYKLNFDYSESLADVLTLAETEPDYKAYTFLQDFYVKMLDSSLYFLYVYTPPVLSSQKSVDKTQVANLYKKFDSFESSLNKSLGSMQNLQEAIEIDIDVTVGASLTRLTSFYRSLEDTIAKACDLSFAMSKIYFDNISPDSESSLINASYDDEVVRLRAADFIKSRFFYFRLLYTQIFYKVNVENAELPSKIKNGQFVSVDSLDSLSAFEQFDYLSTLNLTGITDANTANLESNKDNLKDMLLAFFNAKQNMDLQITYFFAATDNISYYNLKNSTTTLTSKQQSYINYIDLFLKEVYNGSYDILKEFIEICFNV